MDAPILPPNDDEVVTGAGADRLPGRDGEAVAQAPRRVSPEGEETRVEVSFDSTPLADPLPEGEAGEAAGTALVVLPAAPQAEDTQAVKQPMYSTRGAAPGPRGCWAVNKRGDPCAAARRADSDYCGAHSGYGVASDPASWGKVGAARSAEHRRRRATLRLALGHTRLNTPRGILRGVVFADAERVAEAALSPINDPAASSMQKHNAAMALIREVEPTAHLEVSAPLPDDPEGVDSMSLSALLSLAEAHGLRTTKPLPEPDSAL